MWSLLMLTKPSAPWLPWDHTSAHSWGAQNSQGTSPHPWDSKCHCCHVLGTMAVGVPAEMLPQRVAPHNHHLINVFSFNIPAVTPASCPFFMAMFFSRSGCPLLGNIIPTLDSPELPPGMVKSKPQWRKVWQGTVRPRPGVEGTSCHERIDPS